MDRYFIDERGGCIAVRDRENTDEHYPGLHRDTQGVVQYWPGQKIERKCSRCGHVEFVAWDVPEADMSAAAELCDRLNRKSVNIEEKS